MSQTWTPERINQLLLHVITRHYPGTPDYEYIGAQMGVSADAVRVKFNILRRAFASRSVEENHGMQTPPSSPGGKRKAKVVRKQDMEVEGCEDGPVKGAKRVKSVRGAAIKANRKLKEPTEEDGLVTGEVEKENEIKQD